MARVRQAAPSKRKTVTAISSERPTTKQLLIDVSEQLFGERGFDGVSLREIATAAGQSNSNVVQYHFTDKPGLIGAILEDRVTRVEQARCRELALLDSSTPLDTRRLLRILWLPLLSIRDEQGGHAYCRFMLQYLLHPKLTVHPLEAAYELRESEAEDPLPCGRRATRLLFGHYPDRPRELVLRRLSTLATMFLSSVVEHDNRRLRDVDAAGDFDLESILDMAVAALDAPG